MSDLPSDWVEHTFTTRPTVEVELCRIDAYQRGDGSEP